EERSQRRAPAAQERVERETLPARGRARRCGGGRAGRARADRPHVLEGGTQDGGAGPGPGPARGPDGGGTGRPGAGPGRVGPGGRMRDGNRAIHILARACTLDVFIQPVSAAPAVAEKAPATPGARSIRMLVSPDGLFVSVRVSEALRRQGLSEAELTKLLRAH